MKITINFGDIGQAIKDVEKYRKDFLKKEKIFLKRLAEIGVKEATARFKKAQYDGTNDVEVESPTWIDENTIAVRASGQSVLFIEFGTGVHYADPPHEQAEEFGYERGGYGQGRGKNDFWYYKGEQGTNGQIPTDKKMAEKGLVFTHGNPANRCMWETDKEIRSKIKTIAKEVFGA